jgi:hypothetical protein
VVFGAITGENVTYKQDPGEKFVFKMAKEISLMEKTLMSS